MDPLRRSPTYQPLAVSAGVHATARHSPGKIALRVVDATRSYGELSERAQRVTGAALAVPGVGKGARTAILAPNCIEYAEVVCGFADAGLIVATLNPRLTSRELEAQAADCDPQIIVVHPSLEQVVRDARLPNVQRVVVLGEEYESWLRDASPAEACADLEETDPFALVYTSGTTGLPKGVLLSHRSRALTFFGMAMEYGCFGPDDRHLSMAPMAHGAGFAFTLAPMFFGGYVEVIPKFDPELVLRKLAGGDFTGTFMVPTHFQTIFSLERTVLDRYRGPVPGLRAIISNASALPQAIKERIVDYWGEGLLHETYGSTEGGVVTNLRPQDQLRKIRCVGRPFACTDVRLLGESGEEVGVGEVGELYSRSPYLFNGYFDRPDETAATMCDGYVSVGDLARRDEDGYVYIVDRKKDMVISGGFNIYPREVEEVLHKHADVIEAAVIGVADERWGERLRAFVVVRSEEAATPAVLEQHCREYLSGYKVPREFRYVPALPRNAGGKILKNELRALG
ncbi:MAG TPA: AMP-binding protein [Steroidobacteraceae bacterium]|nr:AMP-binding protein [Steroidobacteraceae bacterium]